MVLCNECGESDLTVLLASPSGVNIFPALLNFDRLSPRFCPHILKVLKSAMLLYVVGVGQW